MIKVKAWTIYDLGNVYGFATHDGEGYREVDNQSDIPEPAHTYVRLVFTFDKTDSENLKTLSDNKIEYCHMSEAVGYFTSDITYFPSASIPKFKECITDELEALCNIQSPIIEVKNYLSWFIRNVDTTNSVFVEIFLDRDMLLLENEAKFWGSND